LLEYAAQCWYVIHVLGSEWQVALIWKREL
jgi:hypothetical protein